MTVARARVADGMTYYERLSGLDACFLGFETRNAYMHVAVTAIFDAGPLARPGGGIDAERLRRHFAARVERIPRFRQKLEHLPLVGDAVWVDDEAFDLTRHLRFTRLPHPGSAQQLRTRCAEILERPLDRRWPLWEAWVIDGLADGRFALIAKVHHCIVDGIAGIGMLAQLLDLDPDAVIPDPEPWHPRPAPSTTILVRDEVARRAQGAAEAGLTLGRWLRGPREAAERVGAAAGSLWRLLGTGFTSPPAVRFNEPIGPHRDVAWTSVDLATVKQVARALGGTVNDVVLTMVSGALRASLGESGGPVPEEPLRVLVPVSVRRPEELGAGGNRVSLWMVPLPIAEPDAHRRFQQIHVVTDELKRGGEAAGGTVVAEAANWAGGAVVESLARVVGSTRLYNLIVTNVPGPPVPLHLAGARMVEAYPHLPLFEQQGLGLALLSYAGRLAFCLVADWDQRALLTGATRHLEAGLDELAATAGVPVARVAQAEHRRRRRSPMPTLVRRHA